MSESAWCFQPWGTILQDPLHKALDVLVHVASYRVRAAQMCRAPCSAQDVLEFEDRKRQLQLDFEFWYSNESCIRGSTLFRLKQLSTTEQDSLRKSIGYDIDFDSIRDRLAMNTYWVGKLLLFMEWEMVHLRIHDKFANFPGRLRDRHTEGLAETSILADHICVSVRQLVDEEQGIIGLSSIMMPLWAVHNFSCRHGVVHRVQWCERLLQKQRCWPFKTNYLQYYNNQDTNI